MTPAPGGPIVLVEDNPAHARLLQRFLEGVAGVGPLVHLADGAAALEYLDARPDPPPGVVLLDLRLPRISGLEVLRRLKCGPAAYSVPVVVLSSSAAAADVAAAYAAGANSYLVKPADFDTFREMFRDAVRYWLGWNCPPG